MATAKKAVAATLPPKKRARVQTVVLDGNQVLSAITGMTTMLGRVNEALNRNEAGAFGDPFLRITEAPPAARDRLMDAIHEMPSKTAYAENEKAVREMGLHEMLGDLLELSSNTAAQMRDIRSRVLGEPQGGNAAQSPDAPEPDLGLAKNIVKGVQKSLWSINLDMEAIGMYVLNTSIPR